MHKNLDPARGDRLRTAMEAAGVSNMDLVEALGVSPATVTLWRKGGEIRCTYLASICPRLDITIDWLLTGDGEADPTELRLLRDYRALPASIQRCVSHLVRELAGAD